MKPEENRREHFWNVSRLVNVSFARKWVHTQKDMITYVYSQLMLKHHCDLLVCDTEKV